MASTVVWRSNWIHTRRQPLTSTTVWPPDSPTSRNFWRYRVHARRPLPTHLYPLGPADWDASRGIPDRAGMEVGHPFPLQCV